MACIRIGSEREGNVVIWSSLVCTIADQSDEQYLLFSGSNKRFVTSDDKQIAVLKPQNQG